MKPNAEMDGRRNTMKRELDWGFTVDESTSPAMLRDVDWR